MRCNRAQCAAVILPMLLALAVRLYDLGAQPLWFDEVITHRRALLPLPQLIADALINKHIPTYFLLVRPFDAAVIDEALLRLPSAIFGTLAVGLVALIASEMRSPRAGLLAGLLMALSPIDVQFAQEARSYTMLSCLVLVALWGLMRIVRARGEARDTRAGWLAYALGTVGALNVLVAGAVWWLASNLAMLFALLRRPEPRAATVRLWLIVQGAIVLAWLPALIGLAADSHADPLRGYRWIPPSTLRHVGEVLSAVYLYRASDNLTFALLPTWVPGIGVVVMALALFGAWRLRGDATSLAAVALTVLAMPVILLVISAFLPAWIPRYLLWSTGAFFVLAGIGAAALPRRLFPAVAAAIVILGLTNLAPYYRAEIKPRWNLAAAYLAAHAQPGDSIMASSGGAKFMLEAYAKGHKLAPAISDAGDVARALARLPSTGDVWVVYGRVGQVLATSEADYLRRWTRLGAPAETARLGRQVVAWRFPRPR